MEKRGVKAERIVAAGQSEGAVVVSAADQLAEARRQLDEAIGHVPRG